MDGSSDVPAVSVEQMREVDRIMVVEAGITLIQMMENAGRALASLVVDQLGGDLTHATVAVLAGPGGNGGGGLVAARRLAAWGASVRVILASPVDRLDPVPAHQLASLRWIGVPVHAAPDVGAVLAEADLVVDALIGYGLTGAPREPTATLIRAANASRRPVLALDVPSGLDADTGLPSDPTMTATRTLTLAAPKTGLLAAGAGPWIGDLFLADISVPPEVLHRVGVAGDVPFQGRDILRLTGP